MLAINNTPCSHRQFWYILGAVFLYLLLVQVLQLMVSGTADLDQAEQLVLSQEYRLGYNTQPPLYTWLTKLIFAITGPSLTVLLVLKAVILSSIVVIVAQIARLFALAYWQQLILVCSFLFIPQISWESQRDLTHSTLATALSAATLLQVLWLRKNATLAGYGCLGLLVGLGLLSKYNFSVFAGALLLTGLLVKGYRDVIFNRRIALSILITAIVISPHYYWVSQHLDIVLGSMQKLKAGEGSFFTGVGQAYISALAFLSPLWLFSLLLIRDERREVVGCIEEQRFVLWLPIMILLLVTVFVGLTGAQEIKDRWFQPMLFFMPLLVAMLYKPTTKGLHLYVGLAAFFAILIGSVLSLRVVFAEEFGRYTRQNIPYEVLSQRLEQQVDISGSLFAETTFIGGNMRNAFKGTEVFTPDRMMADSTVTGSAVVLCETQDCSRDDFASWLLTKHGIDVQELNFEALEAPYYFSATRSHTLYWSQIDLP
ncbi:glycosyltransferase family 39 protein [Neptunomonas concharum]|uniref:Glycosyltransferase RgtA/B/C/D-like domain-containing protein n=1 Tax=Neptunomonas concharum TaxID=1031538 RepID=A0A5P1R6B3_9GAMM|nr:glycosyltransferase family 39 protein [Neptunomonas concharum]QEQ95289.1 hypothetical protein F0U83_00435 [Neptunomonas concharum]